MIRNVHWLNFAIVLLSTGLLACALIVGAMVHALLHPPRMTDGRAVARLRRLSPEDLGLAYEEMQFTVRDQRDGRPLNIAGWWIPNPAANGRCVVLIHGYSDAKVGSIAFAPLLHGLGMNILTIDLRAHGDSGGSLCTAGYFERHDVTQVIDQLIAQRPADTRRIVLFGISIGAAVAAATAALRDDLSAVVLESPFATFKSAAMRHGELFGAPGAFLQKPAIVLAQWWSGANFDAVRPIDLIPRIACPLLVIHPGDDPLLSPRDAAALEAAVRGRTDHERASQFWRVENVGHVLAMTNDPAAYHRGIGGFFERLGLAG